MIARLTEQSRYAFFQEIGCFSRVDVALNMQTQLPIKAKFPIPLTIACLYSKLNLSFLENLHTFI